MMRTLRLLLLLLPLGLGGCVVVPDGPPARVYGHGYYGYTPRPYAYSPPRRWYGPPARHYGYGYARPYRW